MKFTIVKDPLPYLYIEDIFSKDDLLLIYRELEFLQPKLLAPEETGTAINDGVILKQNKGIFLDTLYSHRHFSDILSVNRELFTEQVLDALEQCCPGYGLLRTSTNDGTLISYYEDSDYYKPHEDSASITIVSWFFKEPKNFTGGDFIFSDYNIKTIPKNNSAVIFFSCYKHEVTPIKMINKALPCSGRFAMSLFCRHT